MTISKNMIVSLICLGLFAIFSTDIYSQPPENELDNTLGTAYSYLANKKLDLALKSFKKANEIVVKTDDWQAYLDTAQGLMVFKRFEEAKPLVQKADKLLREQKDERAFIALGYAIIGLPQEYRTNLSAENAADKAMETAYDKDNWYSFLEIGKLYNASGNREKSLTSLRKALDIVTTRKTIKGCRELKSVFNKLGYAEYVKKCDKLEFEFREFAADADKSQAPPPPAGWSPVGETVAGPQVPDAEAGIAIRQGADDQIASKKEWLMRQQEINAQQQNWLNSLMYYYYYPSGYELYDYSYDDAVAFGHYRLSHYRYHGGYYTRERY